MNKALPTRLALAVVLALPASAAAQTFDVSAGFSATNNPSGPWQYGYTTTLGGVFTPYTTGSTSGAFQSWGGTPGVYRNASATTQTTGTIIYPAGQVALHPGPSGEYSVIRFIAPMAGSYSLAGNFEGLDFAGPTSTDAHIRLLNVSFFTANVNDYGVPHPFTFLLNLSSGDAVDFAVGVGTNGSYFFDTTGLDATFTFNATGPVSTVPEPGTWVLMATGLLGVTGIARRKRSA